MKTPIPNEIHQYIHCTKCIDELPLGTTPRDWSRLQVGFTRDGEVQVWCLRHDKNVVQIVCIGEVRLRTDANEGLH